MAEFQSLNPYPMISSNSASSSNFKNWLRMLEFLKPYYLRFVGALLFAILNALTAYVLMQGIPTIWSTIFPEPNSLVPHQSTLTSPFAIGSSLNQFGAKITQDFIQLWIKIFAGENSGPLKAAAVVLLVPFIMIIRAFSDYMSKYLLSWVGVRVITDIRQKVFVHIQNLSLDFFNKANVGDLISRITNDCQQAQSAITTVISDAIKHPFTIIILACGLLHEDWKFSLTAVVLAPLCVLPIAIYGRKVRRTSKLSQENQGEIVSHLHENITGVRVVKAFHMEEYEQQKFWETCYRQFSYQMRMVRSINILSPLIEIVAAIGVSAALYYASQQHMPTGKLWGLLIGIFFLYDPIKNLSKLHTTIQKSLASTDRILVILDAKSTVIESSTAKELLPIRDQIQFDNISFRYDSKWVLQNVSLTIPHGKTIALVGPSGAGKTTLLNLLPRFYDPTTGRILIDNTDLREVTLRSLRQQMALVTQDAILFNDTIGNNIRYGSMDTTQDQMFEAAKRAYAHDFILHQPHGYDTVVGDKGVKLSGGQKQRLAIARAILKNPSILLLDEATSALDTESERMVQQALDELIRGRTVIAIAHRLSTIQHADQIVVLEHGRMIEQGRHEELLSSGKLYRRLYDLQFREG